MWSADGDRIRQDRARGRPGGGQESFERACRDGWPPSFVLAPAGNAQGVSTGVYEGCRPLGRSAASRSVGPTQSVAPIASSQACACLSTPWTMASNLESLVCSLVPQARQNDALRDELTAHCTEIINR